MNVSHCQACNAAFVKQANQGMRKYCWKCSERADLRRKKVSAVQVERRSIGKEVGAPKSAAAARSMAYERPHPELRWQVRIAVPFSYAASKNHIYALRARGHVHLRQESRDMRSLITARLRDALDGVRVAHNKVWIDILVQKSNHKGDAINVVDLVCDGIKKALPVDDRWFSIRSLDWEVVRQDGKIIICVGQEHDFDAQVCSYCGQIQPLNNFKKAKGRHLNVGRECLSCVSEIRAERKRRTTGALRVAA